MINSLYENIGGKLKGLTKWAFIIQALAAIIAGIALIATDEDFIVIGILVMVIVPLVAWISSWMLYAFGQLVEDNERIRKSIVQDETSSQCYNHNGTKSTSAAKTSDCSEPGYWTCSACKRENSVSREECWHCGQKQVKN